VYFRANPRICSTPFQYVWLAAVNVTAWASSEKYSSHLFFPPSLMNLLRRLTWEREIKKRVITISAVCYVGSEPCSRNAGLGLSTVRFSCGKPWTGAISSEARDFISMREWDENLALAIPRSFLSAKSATPVVYKSTDEDFGQTRYGRLIDLVHVFVDSNEPKMGFLSLGTPRVSVFSPSFVEVSGCVESGEGLDEVGCQTGS
jgi:hypothetical protein